MRRAAVPLYMAAGWALWGRLRARQHALWCTAWAACTAAVLVPAGLIELRCAAPPAARLQTRIRSTALVYRLDTTQHAALSVQQ